MRSNVVLKVCCDGLCEPKNPGGIATYGFVVYGSGNEVLREEGGFIRRGEGATNNVAEYAAAIRGLRWALDNDYGRDGEHGGGRVVLRGDSKLLVNQLSGAWAVRSPSIRPLWSEARELMSQFGSASVEWVPREENAEADRLSVAAYVEVLESERGRRAGDVELRDLGRGLYLAQDRYLVDAVFGLCPCRDHQETNRPRFLREAGLSVRCKHLLAAGARWDQPVRACTPGAAPSDRGSRVPGKKSA